MSEYKPVPVGTARSIAHAFDKDVVVIVAYENARDVTHTTTYGRDALDKIRAADLGEILAKAAGCDIGKSQVNEDFRLPALRAQRIDELLAATEQMLGSAHPNPTEHPAMAAAWERARSAVADYKSGKS